MALARWSDSTTTTRLYWSALKRLERQVLVLIHPVCLLLTLRRVVPCELNLTRLPDGDKKELLHRAIERAREHLPLRSE